MNNRKLFHIVLLPVYLLLSACGGGGGSGETGKPTYSETLSAELVKQGMAADMAQFFSEVKLKSSCTDNTNCTLEYTYPNGAKRNVTLTATPNQQYTPTAEEIANTATVVNPVYHGQFTATGIEEISPPVDTHIEIGYFVPSSSVSKNASPKAQPGVLSKQTAKLIALARAPGTNDGFQINWSESGSKGVDVAIGSLLEHYAGLGGTVKTTGSIYAVAAALSDISGAMTISKQVQAWQAELDALERCAADPTNQIAQSDPNYTATTVANLRTARTELKRISLMRFLNVMDETGAGIHPVTAILSIPLKQAFAWNEQTLKDVSEKLMQDARSSVVSCKPSCPASFSATGVSESQINVSWAAAPVSSGINAVTSYILHGGHANGVTTADTTWPDIGLARSTQYCYTISAFNDYGSSGSCPQACGTTLGPPEIHSTGPVNNATGVSVKTAVTATFSEVVDAATVTAAGTFTLAGPGGQVGGSVSYSGQTATFTPAADLAFSTTYTATVTTAIKDLDGIAMEAARSWSFKTEAAPVAGNLQFSANYGGGSILASGTADVTWTKFEDSGDVRRYVPSGTITADITISGCDPLHATVPIDATVPNNPGPTMVVYTATNVAFPKSYGFSVTGAPNTILNFMCGDSPKVVSPTPASAVLIIMVGNCPSGGLVPFVNEAQLAGTYSCAETGMETVTWDFSN